jgi:hypothetical protein
MTAEILEGIDEAKKEAPAPPKDRKSIVAQLLSAFSGTKAPLSRPLLNVLDVTPAEAREAGFKVNLPRFNFGDRFYQHLRFKRVSGKWKVRQ